MATKHGRRGSDYAIGFDDCGVWIRAGEVGVKRPASVLVVGAHPDDEIIGAGSRLSSLPGLTIAHVTDGAPRNMYDAERNGFSSRASYAAARRHELSRALAEVGAGSARKVNFGVPDQETAFALAEVTSWIERLLRLLEPDLVLTHPYEGGHPDHDACAYAVQRAVRNLSEARCEPHVIEFACYHAAHGGIQTLEFLEGGGFVMELNSAERAAKQRAFGCFETQKQTLSLFQCATERFRSSPGYDFTKPPHPGELYYERFDWGMTGARFRDLVRRQESL